LGTDCKEISKKQQSTSHDSNSALTITALQVNVALSAADVAMFD